MTNVNADSANDTGLQPHTTETPTRPISFYREFDADLSTIEGRIGWICTRFEVQPPTLSYDPDEPTELVMSQEFGEWALREGVDVNWLVCGAMTGALEAYREQHRVTPDRLKFSEQLGKFDENEYKILLAGLKLVTRAGADLDDVIQGVFAQIGVYRAGKRHSTPVSPEA